MAGTVKPIPEGYHTITPYLTIRDAARAIEFYQRAFGAALRLRMDQPNGNVGHAEMTLGDSNFMLSEESPETGCHSPASLQGTTGSLFVYVPDVDAAFARAVKAGAKPVMPVSDMFWGDRYGALVDPFGHRWSLATHKEDLTQEQISQRARAAFAQPAGS